MMMKQRTCSRMQVLLFLMITVLAITGLINWLLPRGGEARALRHLLRWIHEGAAVGFLTFVAAHLYCQLEMIRRNLRRFSLWGRD
jgi:cytochrome b subunit of formate dehydrogenase